MFCKDLPSSLVQLSNYLYSEKETSKGVSDNYELINYPWMPDYSEDINLNNIQLDMDLDNDDLDKEEPAG